jgi:formylglycine-generating enzyme required for sulfatase activity
MAPPVETSSAKPLPADTAPDGPPPAMAPFDADQANAHQEAWAGHLETEVESTNTVGMKLRLIPPGEFLMGSPHEEIEELVRSTRERAEHDAFRHEGPQHRVQITQGFYIGCCEVTQQQYRDVMGVNHSHFSPTGGGKKAVDGIDSAQHPVETVGWLDAVDFCNNLSKIEHLLP